MTEHLRLIKERLLHLQKMKNYLVYSHQRVTRFLPVIDWKLLEPEQHEALAAFRVRFSEFQEHLGKVMRALAIEEEVDVERFGTVLAFMEKIGVLDSSENWKLMRELRNAVNHEYEENTERLNDFFTALVDATPVLLSYFDRLTQFCVDTYGAG